MTIVTFTNLFPSSVMPTHGLFVRERMRRVAAASGLPWQIVAPVPDVVWPLRRGIYRQWRAVPEHEVFEGDEVHHPRYRHWPGLSLRRQADAMADGARQVLRRLQAAGPIVIDAHYVWPDGIAAAQLARELGVPFTVTARGTDINVIAQDPFVRERIRALAPHARGLFAVSRALAERFAEVAGLATGRVTQVRNGVDLERFAPGDVAAARRELGLPLQGRLLLGVGRLVAGKGFELAARALASLPQDVRLVLVGDGPERAAIAAAGGDRVTFLGARSPAVVATCYRACDVFVLPSEREGWPNVVTEALASGLRVVATAVGGIPEILDCGEDMALGGVGPRGALVPRGDQTALTAALGAVLEQPTDRTGVREFATRYGWDEPVSQLVTTFREALGAVA
ncbi:MAG: glycosyltransferase [bacterium]|nr:glycosyltransferase [bacterium]